MGAVSVNKVAALRVRDVMVKDVAYVSVPGQGRKFLKCLKRGRFQEFLC